MSDLLSSFYSKLYSSEKHDSPDLSRVSLARKVVDNLKSGIPNNEILNIGSGPQSLERQLWSMGPHSLLNDFRFSTIDIANIQSKKLLGRNRSNMSHTQASALHLPYKDGSFGLVVSNHAIDFLPRDAFDEAYRVLSTNGKAVFYFHHPDMIPDDLNGVRNDDVRKFWGELRDNNHLFGSETEIANEMSSHGFRVDSIDLNSDLKDKWWEVKLEKSK